jgi:hypothetical protein
VQNLNEHNITDEVIRRFASAPNPRLQAIMTSLVKHMHALREVHLTEDEWFRVSSCYERLSARRQVRNLSCCPIRSACQPWSHKITHDLRA